MCTEIGNCSMMEDHRMTGNLSEVQSSLEDLYDQYLFHRLRIYIPAIAYTVILMITGLIGNSIVWIVYYYKWSKCSTRTFILSLAICDLINCVITMPTEITLMVDNSVFSLAVLCKLSRFTTYACNSTSTMVLIAVAFDRFQRICRPYKAAMTPTTARYMVIMIITIAITITWPSLVIYGRHSLSLRSGTHNMNLTVHICLIDDNFVSTSYPLLYFGVHAIGTIITFVTLVVLYSCVGITVHQQWNFRKTRSVMATRPQNGNTDSLCKLQPVIQSRTPCLQDRCVRTSLMLSVVTFVYIASFIPFLVIVIHRTFYPSSWTKMSSSCEMIYQVFLRSYLLNCAVNPIIYSFYNFQFRRFCVKLFKNGANEFSLESTRNRNWQEQ